MARESKAELMDRLRREGRWEAFKVRREQLKSEGIPAKQAWFQAATEFPPAEQPGQSSVRVPLDQLQKLQGKKAIPTLEAAFWVFENLDLPWIEPIDAPSPGAWSLLQWAKQSQFNRSDFYRTFGPKLLASTLPESVKRQRSRDMERALEECSSFCNVTSYVG
jgi:hypothetical protein